MLTVHIHPNYIKSIKYDLYYFPMENAQSP